VKDSDDEPVGGAVSSAGIPTWQWRTGARIYERLIWGARTRARIRALETLANALRAERDDLLARAEKAEAKARAPLIEAAQQVLADVAVERHRQQDLHGDGSASHLPAGLSWAALMQLAARAQTEEAAQANVEARAAAGTLTGLDVLWEELVEAVCARTPEERYEELVQVSATAAAIAEQIRRDL